MTHTPAPWNIKRNGPTSIGGRAVHIVDGGRILTFGSDGEEGIYANNMDDVPLMNAAPDLLAACEAWTAYMDAIDNGDDDAEADRLFDAAVRKTAAAIRKAVL